MPDTSNSCKCKGFYKPADCPVHETMNIIVKLSKNSVYGMKSFKKLFYHAKSDSYIEILNEKESNNKWSSGQLLWDNEPLVDVTDDVVHNIEHLKRKREKRGS